MGCFREVKAKGFSIPVEPPKVQSKVFEDNCGALEMAHLPKIQPRTKHINQSFHFFSWAVEKQRGYHRGKPYEDQIADMLTKPKESFTRQ